MARIFLSVFAAEERRGCSVRPAFHRNLRNVLLCGHSMNGSLKNSSIQRKLP